MREYRALADFPHIKLNIKSIRQYSSSMDSYLEDHFWYKDILVQYHAYIRVMWLGFKPMSEVIWGKQGWLFFARGNLIDDYRKIKMFKTSHLEKWNNSLRKRHEFLSNRGIRYLFAIVPNKQTIYSEHLPSNIKPINSRSKLDQFIKFVKIHSNVPIYDFRRVLIKAKEKNKIYYKTDTHWNDIGMYEGYKGLLKYLREWFPDKIQQTELKLFKSNIIIINGDLARMAGLSKYLSEKTVKMEVINPCASKEFIDLPEDFKPIVKPYVMTCADKKLTMIMIGDSFFYGFEDYISEHFYRVIFIPVRYNERLMAYLIDQYEPDLVLEEIVERKLNRKASDIEVF